MVTKNKKKEKQLTRKTKILLWIGVGVLIIVGILNLFPLIQSLVLRNSLASESANVLNKNLSVIQNASKEAMSKATKTLETSQLSTYSATYKSCYMDTTDSGWIASNYNYKCVLNNFALFEVVENSAFMADINQYAEKYSETTDSNASYSEYYGEIYSFDITQSKVFSFKDLPREIHVVKNNTYKNAQDVLRVENIYASPAVVAYAASDAFANKHLIEENGSETLDTDKTYLILRTSSEYFNENTGCRMPSILFCEAPTKI